MKSPRWRSGEWAAICSYLQFETFLFEAGDDVAHKPTLDAVGLDHDVGAFGVGHDDLRWVVGLVGRKKRSCYKC